MKNKIDVRDVVENCRILSFEAYKSLSDFERSNLQGDRACAQFPLRDELVRLQKEAGVYGKYCMSGLEISDYENVNSELKDTLIRKHELMDLMRRKRMTADLSDAAHALRLAKESEPPFLRALILSSAVSFASFYFFRPSALLGAGGAAAGILFAYFYLKDARTELRTEIAQRESDFTDKEEELRRENDLAKIRLTIPSQ